MPIIDFGVLSPDVRNILLSNIRRALKPGGLFLFDVLNDSQLDQKVGDINWDIPEQGFWRDKLSATFKLILIS